MNNILLYISTILIWATTWYALKVQAPLAPHELSILYRFAIPTIGLFLWCRYRKINLRFKLKDHFFLFLTGLAMFSVHFLFIYQAANFIASGIIAVIFSGVSFLTIAHNYLFFNTRPQRRTIMGSLIGIAGLCVFFWDEFSNLSWQSDFIKGLMYCSIGALIFSLGSPLTRRNQSRGLANIPSISIAMLYGSIAMCLYLYLKGTTIVFPLSTIYWSSVLYLAIPGTAAFLCYLQLIKNVGPELAGYTTVVTPVLALIISAGLENYRFSTFDIVGLSMVIAGNVFVLRKKKG